MVDGSPTVASRVRRPIVFLGALTLVAATLLAPSVASADTQPIDPTQTPTTSSDPLPTTQINGIVWAQAVVGNTVYVGGEFTKARPAGSPLGSNEVVRNNILAYNLTTGELISTWAPNANGSVLSIAASPDGSRVYVSGTFTQIAGQTRYRVAAFDTATGALTSFAPSINSKVQVVKATNSVVYLGGTFSSLNSQSRTGIGAVTAAGATLAFAPTTAGGSTRGIAVSPDGTRVAIGGSFTTANGSNRPGYGLALVDSSTGKTNLAFPANNVIRNGGANAAIYSMSTADDDSFYATGYTFGTGGNFEGAARIRWSTGAIVWVEGCKGDTYSSYPTAGLVYVVGHPHNCSALSDGFPDRPTASQAKRAMAFTNSVKGVNTGTFGNQPAPALTDYFPELNTGTVSGADQAAWSISGGSGYIVLGGEFTRANNTAQQGLVRYAPREIAPNRDGPVLSGDSIKPTLSTPSSNTVRLSFKTSWDHDNERLTYQIVRNGVVVGSTTADSRFYRLPTVTYNDAGVSGGTTYTYQVRAVDPYGNAATSTSASITATGGATNTPPAASFTTSTNGLSVSVNGSASADPGGSISSYAWNFGDGGTATGVTASHAYAAAGTYTVTLTVTDNQGATGSTTRSVTVSVVVPPTGPLATDDFFRTVAGGWGSATSGGAWTLSPAAPFAVNGAVGTVTSSTAGALATAKLNSVSSASSDTTVTVSVGQAITGGTHFISVLGRTVGTADYRAKVSIYAAGNVNLNLVRTDTSLAGGAVAGLTYTPGTQLKVRVQVTGTNPTTIRAKVWVAGTAEPAAWQYSATDATAELQTAGGVGTQVYVGGTSTGLPRVTSFDDLSVVTP